MSASNQRNDLIFRNYLTSGISATKALAFTPDIVCHFGNELDASTLIKEYNQFISLPLQPNEINLIYIRATTTSNIAPGDRAAVIMRTVPSELILWPQVWNKKKPLGPGPLMFPSLSPNKVMALNTPFILSPSSMGGFHNVFIATQGLVWNDYTDGGPIRLRDALPAPPADVKNWKELLDFINNDTSTVYYNVVVADPKAPVVTMSTRLRVIDDGQSPLDFNIMIENSLMPDGTSVSLSSPTGAINMAPTLISDNTDVGVHVALDPGFDETITLTVHLPSDAVVETFAWISLQASIVVPQALQQGIPITEVHLLGAQNIVFHDDATTNLRFASPAANALRKYVQATKDVAQSVMSGDAAASLFASTFSATGWWFRDALNDSNHFPRTESLYISPDTQPVGNAPLSTPASILGGSNANIDYSASHNVTINQGEPNYTYIRGSCTQGNGYAVEARMFCVPNNLLLYPTKYAQWSVQDFDDKGEPYVAIRTITSPSANSFNVLNNPFNILDPKALPPQNDHYCIIAETRHPSAECPDPDWPHENTGAFSSGAGFNNWVGSTPTVSERNMGFKTGGAELLCSCNVAIPYNVYTSSAEWTLQVDGYNVPVGSAWKLVGSGPAIPGLTIGFAQTTVTASNMVQGCHFTGLPSSGYEFSVVLQWFAQGHAPGAGMKFSFSLHTTSPPAGPKALGAGQFRAAATLPKEAANWPFTVGIYHPGVQHLQDGKKHSKAYLGKVFKDIGPNPWPYASGDGDIDAYDAIGPVPVYSVGGDHWNLV